MAHPAVKAGITHCGFGGTVEYISKGVPAILWPHFGDQNLNAKLVNEAGAGVILYQKHKIEAPGGKLRPFSFETPVFTSEKVTECVKEVI